MSTHVVRIESHAHMANSQITPDQPSVVIGMFTRNSRNFLMSGNSLFITIFT